MSWGASVAERKWPSLALLALCQIAAMALWFSATAVIPALQASHQLSAFTQSLFTSAVALGFVAGSLTSAVLGLADRLDPRRFIMASALVASLAYVSVRPDENAMFASRLSNSPSRSGALAAILPRASWAHRSASLARAGE